MLKYLFSGLTFSLLLVVFACKNDSKPAPSTNTEAQPDPQLAQLTALIEKTPNNDTLYFKRAEVYYQLDGFDEALADLNKALSIDSMKPQYYHLLADVLIDYARPNDSKRAIDVLKLAANRFPGRIPTLLKLSEFHLIVQQHNEALGALNKILEQDPQNAEAFFMTGRVALDMGDSTRAVNALQKSVRLDAENADAWYFLGRLFYEKNNPLCLQYFDNALRVDSNYIEAREFKGIYYKRKKDFTKAFEIYRDMIVRYPDYPNPYFDMGIIYLDQDSLNKAYSNFDLAIKTDPLFIRAFYYRGLVSEQLGNIDAARADYSTASKMAPNYEEPKAALARLK